MHDHEPTPPYVAPADRTMLVLLHLSQFAGYLVPLGGFAVPVLIWLLQKDDSPEIDEHGRNVTNWILSWLIYTMASVVLVFVVIGIPLLWLLGVLAIIFPIIGAVKASNGVAWKYPMTIPFF